MNSKGQIDQIVTSAIVFIVVLVIMGVFSYATNFASNFFDTSASVSSYASSNGGSAALRDVFLADRVIVEGAEVMVLDALKKGIDEGNEDILSTVKKKFMDKYSCGEKNYLRVIDSEVKIVKARGAEEGVDRERVYLIYPIESHGVGFEESVFEVGDKSFAVGVKGVARC